MGTSERTFLGLSGLVLGVVLAGCGGVSSAPTEESTPTAEAAAGSPQAIESTSAPESSAGMSSPEGDTENRFDWETEPSIELTVVEGEYGVLEFDLGSSPDIQITIPTESEAIYDLPVIEDEAAFDEIYGDNAATAGLPIEGLSEGVGKGVIVVPAEGGEPENIYFQVTVNAAD